MSSKTKDTSENITKENEKINKKSKKAKQNTTTTEKEENPSENTNIKDTTTKKEENSSENTTVKESSQNSLPLYEREKDKKEIVVLKLSDYDKKYIMQTIYNDHTIKSIKARMQLVLKIDSRIYEKYFENCYSVEEIKKLVEENKFEVTIL